MRQVKRRSLCEQLLENLRRSILLGELSPQEHLSETLLAEQFGTSRGPIRDALNVLVQEGFATRSSNGRTVVSGFTPKDISDVYDTRFLIESHAVNKWMRSNRSANAKIFHNIYENIQNAQFPRITSSEFSELDLDFHEQLVRLSSDRFLLQAWLGVRDVVRALLDFTNNDRNYDATIETHKSILFFLERRDGEETNRLLEKHFELAKSIMQSSLAEWQAAQTNNRIL